MVNTISAVNPQCFMPALRHQQPGDGRGEATPGTAWKSVHPARDTHSPCGLAAHQEVCDACSCPQHFWSVWCLLLPRATHRDRLSITQLKT